MNKDSFLKLLAIYGIVFVGNSSMNAAIAYGSTEEFSGETILKLDTSKLQKDMGWNAGCNSCSG